MKVSCSLALLLILICDIRTIVILAYDLCIFFFFANCISNSPSDQAHSAMNCGESFGLLYGIIHLLPSVCCLVVFAISIWCDTLSALLLRCISRSYGMTHYSIIVYHVNCISYIILYDVT